MIAGTGKDWYVRPMEEFRGNPANKRFVLQDVKRLPSRFHARINGTRLARTA